MTLLMEEVPWPVMVALAREEAKFVTKWVG
jgi:hypothetical protein